MEDGGIGVHHLPTPIKTIRFNFLQTFITRSDRETAWYFQAHNIRMYAPDLHAEAVLKLNLNSTRFPILTPFYVSALQAWHDIGPIVNPNLQSLEDLRHIPLRDSTLMTPYICDYKVMLDEAWNTLNIIYIGDLIIENGQWKELKDIDTTHCTQPTSRRLAGNLRKAAAFFHHNYPNLSFIYSAGPC
jgi:hypothetical protein